MAIETLVGASYVSQRLSFEQPMSSGRANEFLRGHGIDAVGIDGSGNYKWSKDKVEELRERLMTEKIDQKNANNLDQKTVENIVALRKTLRSEFENIENELKTIKTQNQSIFASVSADRVLVTSQGDMTSDDKSEITDRVINELAGFIGSYFAEIQRVLAQQIDSSLESIDEKIERIEKNGNGHNRAVGECKQKIQEVDQQIKNLISNVYQTNKATRDELVKAVTRNEQAIDELRTTIEPSLNRIYANTKELNQLQGLIKGLR